MIGNPAIAIALLGVRDGLRSSKWGVPAILLFLTALVYGPLIPALGFYWDDWPVIQMIRNRSDLWSFYAYDRPFSAWTYVLTAPLLGIRTIGWHLLMLGLRWLASVGAWWTFKQVWPGHPVKALSAALLFAVYPSFTLQPMAVAFSQHFITYTAFIFSLGAMLAARAQPARRGLFTALAIALQVLHLATMEYFWGLELVRPVLLWAMRAQDTGVKTRFRTALKSSWPYLAVLAVFLAWRFYLLELPEEDPNALALLELYRADPVAGLLHSFNIVARDLVHMVFRTWATSLGPSLIDVTDRFLLVSWGLAIAAGAAVFAYLKGMPSSDHRRTNTAPFYAAAIPVGAFAAIVSLLPSWITDHEITVGLFASRFSLPAIFGSSLFLIGLFDLLLRRTVYKHFVTAVLVCLATGVHLRNANDFRWDWVKQERFFRQFTQRVPGLQNGTAVFSDGAIFQYTAEYPTSAALNTVYPLLVEFPQQSYWFFELDDRFATRMEDFVIGTRVKGDLRNLRFRGNSLDGLTVFFEPDSGSCLRVLSPEQAALPMLPELTAQAAQVSDPGQILTEVEFQRETLDLIFGRSDPLTWCDLFQQAELAAQRGDWEAVSALGRQAMELGLEPNERLEWFVFIEAYVQIGDWSGAAALLLERVYDPTVILDTTVVCTLWSQLGAGDPTDVTDLLRCGGDADS